MTDKPAIDGWVNPILGDPPSHELSYLFPAVAERRKKALSAEDMIEMMDRNGVEKSVLCVGYGGRDDMAWVRETIRDHPDRYAASLLVDPRKGMEAVRALESAVKDDGFVMARAIAFETQLPYDHAAYYPVYAKCVELDIPIGLNVGIPGPRVPGKHQHPLALDEVCYFFPDLKIIMSHGGDPWADLCVKLMLKWPNLYWMSSAFAPKHIPEAIVNFANTRGADKIMWASDYPLLTMERCIEEIGAMPFRDDERRRKYLGDNARRVILGQDAT